MAAKKRRLVEKLKEGGFEFHVFDSETDVIHKRRLIGTIIGMKERNGRHCFRLGCDSRKAPRTYRGRIKAAEALQIIEALSRESKKKRWSSEELIIRSWDDKPHASPKQER